MTYLKATTLLATTIIATLSFAQAMTLDEQGNKDTGSHPSIRSHNPKDEIVNFLGKRQFLIGQRGERLKAKLARMTEEESRLYLKTLQSMQTEKLQEHVPGILFNSKDEGALSKFLEGLKPSKKNEENNEEEPKKSLNPYQDIRVEIISFLTKKGLLPDFKINRLHTKLNGMVGNRDDLDAYLGFLQSRTETQLKLHARCIPSDAEGDSQFSELVDKRVKQWREEEKKKDTLSNEKEISSHTILPNNQINPNDYLTEEELTLMQGIQKIREEELNKVTIISNEENNKQEPSTTQVGGQSPQDKILELLAPVLTSMSDDALGNYLEILQKLPDEESSLYLESINAMNELQREEHVQNVLNKLRTEGLPKGMNTNKININETEKNKKTHTTSQEDEIFFKTDKEYSPYRLKKEEEKKKQDQKPPVVNLVNNFLNLLHPNFKQQLVGDRPQEVVEDNVTREARRFQECLKNSLAGKGWVYDN